MRTLRVLGLIPLALVAAGCFQMTTVVKVNGDGSGTIDHTMLVTKQALAQLRNFGALSGGRGGATLDLTSEEQARALVDSLGPGVAYISSTPIDNGLSQGRQTTYAFTDVGQIRISQQPQTGGLSVRTQEFNPAGGDITCSLTHEANGNAVMHINLPELNLNLSNANLGGGTTAGNPALGQQLAMVRALLAGARVSISVEPAGQLVKTNSPFVDGSRVTLLEVDLDKVLGNEAVLTALQSATTSDQLKAALKDVPGLKMVMDREVTIEFTPAK
jgi:hypothetical protein